MPRSNENKSCGAYLLQKPRDIQTHQYPSTLETPSLEPSGLHRLAYINNEIKAGSDS